MRKISALFGSIVLISVGWLLCAAPAYAKLSDIVDPANITKRFPGGIGDVITQLLPYLFGLAAMLALLFLIWGGIKYMMAQGDPKQLDSAKNTITSAVIGLIIILSVTLIFFIIKVVFSIDIFGQMVAPAYAAPVDISKLFPPAAVFSDFGKFLTKIILFALFAAALIFFGLMVWGGIRYLNSGGNEETVEKARNTLMNAFIGLLIVVASFVIIEIIIGVFSTAGVEIPNIF